MSKKQTNSVLFIATLGVYIGLLMAGAAPAVVAQQAAAMTRNFELSDEIEKKDNLDDDPDETRHRADVSLENYLDAVEEFISDIRELTQLPGFLLPDLPQEYESVTRFPCTDASTKTGFVDSKHFVWDSALQDSFAQIHSTGLESFRELAVCELHHEFPESLASTLTKSVILDSQNLLISVSFKATSKDQAKQLSLYFRDTVTDNLEISLSQTKVAVLKYSEFSPRNNEMFIITRLPRAALDELLAKEAK